MEHRAGDRSVGLERSPQWNLLPTDLLTPSDPPVKSIAASGSYASYKKAAPRTPRGQPLHLCV
jgi:hypothetical protein